jgi:CBS domain-containing protein
MGSSVADTGNNALALAAIEALREHAPFDKMDIESLRYLASALRLGYHARGSPVVGPDDGPADRMYIVKSGRVRGAAPAEGSTVDDMLEAGECFPVAALIARRAATYAYRAEQDSFCWELGAESFRVLLERSAHFRAFCTDQLALLLDQSQQALRADTREALIDGAGLFAPLRTAVARAPVSCTAEATVGEAIRRMHGERVGCIVVAQAAGVPAGIFTTHDVLERVAWPQIPMQTPIAALMTPGPFMLDEEAPIMDALLAMVSHGIRHVVVTRDGKLSGIVSERDLFALQRVSLHGTAEGIRAAQGIESLAEAASNIRQLARRLFARGVGAGHLTQVMSALNDALTQRLISLAAARRALPGRWCWLALGSEGRLEQTFATDQDNALIFAADGDTVDARRLFIDFADEVNRGLQACGFPLCKGDIMARNPRWCLSPQEWRGVFDRWIRIPEPEALLNASIFFDFRPLAGDARLAGELRDAVVAQARATPRFWHAMAENALRVRPPLGVLRDFAIHDPDSPPGVLNLKLFAVRPLVDAARVLALANGVRETSTVARLCAAGEASLLPGSEAAAAVEAFHYVQALRLKRQVLDPRIAADDPNRVRIDDLNAIDRRVLKEALRQAALLQDRLRIDYQ